MKCLVRGEGFSISLFNGRGVIDIHSIDDNGIGPFVNPNLDCHIAVRVDFCHI